MSQRIKHTLQAAKGFLWDGESYCTYTPFICHAIDYALERRCSESQELGDPAILLLKGAGMPTNGGGFLEFISQADYNARREDKVRQAWRHAWLDLMIQFCEEEGL